MKNIILDKKDPMVDITEYLDDAKMAKNNKGKSYHYCALLTNYQSAHNIEREFFNVTDLTNNDGWSLLISTTFLFNIQINNVYEVVVNMKKSSNYSWVTKKYFVVKDKSEESISVEFCDTAYSAFKILN